jgi:UrcA family protein
MSRSIKVPIKALVAGLAIMGLTHTAAAATSFNKPGANKILVRFTDLNLDNEEGAATLLKRLSKAAKQVCNMPPLGSENLYPQSHGHACRDGALEDAVARVDHPVVTALYRSTRQNSITKVASR